jgi:hypothetical protein
MKLAGFNFTKIYAEKLKGNVKEIKVDTKINLEDIKEIKSNLSSQNDSLLGIEFEYNINYKDLAKLEFKGNLILILDPKKAEEIIKNFKGKKMAEDFKVAIFNLILKKSSIKALQLEEELNIPSHFKLPSLKFEKKN